MLGTYLEEGSSRFPNEIFAIIIDNVADDHPSLRNAALVCKNFAALAQPCIFQIIRLPGNCRVDNQHFPMVRERRLVFKNLKIARLVQQFHFTSLSEDDSLHELKDAASTLGSMPSLTALDILLPIDCHYRAIAAATPRGTLRFLYIDSTYNLDATGLTYFAEMLMSLAVLEVLAVSRPHLGSETRGIVLPISLKIAAFMAISDQFLHAFALGLELSHPPSLRTFFLSPRSSEFNQGCLALLRKLHIDAEVILDGLSCLSGLALKELRAPSIVCFCRQSRNFAHLLSLFTATLPEPIHDITIDVVAQRVEHVHPTDYDQAWTDLDSGLMKRHGLGLLTRVCFRYTKRDFSIHLGPFSARQEEDEVEDRTILDHIERLLPKSKRKGFLEQSWRNCTCSPPLIRIHPGMQLSRLAIMQIISFGSITLN
ncbi:hypothetical protein GYMLUDRAFT_671899 [Collybiopsis luxurians FD-317 M1]|uniref:F-box domain-containing protein n=1 Tax=Collybiopsis luxurians FD-317 M1 TaxID=944289 RepID=A0A0D0B7V9_9AGAR|nr:hypothetical protein GYMLUDRAFT_671899 [Collybiopsis luxurians FD-317 M1]